MSSPISTSPLVSFCIPTYQRARYLDSLLGSLCLELADFPYPCEVFISDNASADDTAEVVARYQANLPIRYVRQAENRGGRANYQFLQAQARGRYLVYIADDDAVMGARVAEVIALMEAQPEVGIVYAPWKLLDLVQDLDLGQFYRQDRDVRIEAGQQRDLLDTLLRYGIFPDINICRRDLVQAALPRIHQQAYYAYVQAAEYVDRSAVLFLKEPYYVSITNYFADHQREQGGNEEAETAWDRYRAGLEYILGRARSQLSESERAEFLLRIEQMIARRIAVAVRLRLGADRDAVETYYLAYRLKALGAESLLPMDLDTLRGFAALQFWLTDPELGRGVQQRLCLGDFGEDLRDYIRQRSDQPVQFLADTRDLPPLGEQGLVLSRLPLSEAERQHLGGACVIQESELLRKFAA